MPRIVVRLPENRDRPGTIHLENNLGLIVAGPFPVLGRSNSRDAGRSNNPSRDPLRPFGDTPAGQWLVSGWIPTGTGTSRPVDSFGPHGALTMEGLGGDALTAAVNGRTNIYIHSGRPGATGPESLRATGGCLRVSNNNMLRLTTALTQLAVAEGPPRTASTITDNDIIVDVGVGTDDLDPQVSDPPGDSGTWDGFPQGQTIPPPDDLLARARRALEQARRQGPGGPGIQRLQQQLERELNQRQGINQLQRTRHNRIDDLRQAIQDRQREENTRQQTEQQQDAARGAREERERQAAERERQDNERRAQERVERERQENERRAQERAERERQENERRQRERQERNEAHAERLAEQARARQEDQQRRREEQAERERQLREQEAAQRERQQREQQQRQQQEREQRQREQRQRDQQQQQQGQTISGDQQNRNLAYQYGWNSPDDRPDLFGSLPPDLADRLREPLTVDELLAIRRRLLNSR